MLVLWEGHLTDKSDDRVGLLNIIGFRRGGICNLQNTPALPGGRMLKFGVDRRIKVRQLKTSIKAYVEFLMNSHLKKFLFIVDAAFVF